MRRLQITLPERLADDMKKMTSPGKRSRFIAEAVEEKLARLRFSEAVDRALEMPEWKDADHPELAKGATEYVRRLRRKDSERHR